MKNKILIFCLLLVSLIACSNDNKNMEQEEQEKNGSIIGKWQLFEECTYGTFTEKSCKDVAPENQYYYEFKNDGTIITSRYSVEECNQGFFQKLENEVYFEFSCTSYTIPIVELTEQELHLRVTGDDSATIYKYRIIKN